MSSLHEGRPWRFGWSLTPDADTPLETLDVTAVPGGGFMVDLLDRHAGLPDVDYGSVRVTLAIGDDAGSVNSTMTQTGNQWLIAPAAPVPAPPAEAPTQPECRDGSRGCVSFLRSPRVGATSRRCSASAALADAADHAARAPKQLERGPGTSGNPRSITATLPLSSWRSRSR